MDLNELLNNYLIKMNNKQPAERKSIGGLIYGFASAFCDYYFDLAN